MVLLRRSAVDDGAVVLLVIFQHIVKMLGWVSNSAASFKRMFSHIFHRNSDDSLEVLRDVGHCAGAAAEKSRSALQVAGLSSRSSGAYGMALVRNAAILAVGWSAVQQPSACDHVAGHRNVVMSCFFSGLKNTGVNHGEPIITQPLYRNYHSLNLFALLRAPNPMPTCS